MSMLSINTDEISIFLSTINVAFIRINYTSALKTKVEPHLLIANFV